MFYFAPSLSNACECTFAAVHGVVQRWWVAEEVRRNLIRGSSDPVETIAGG